MEGVRKEVPVVEPCRRKASVSIYHKWLKELPTLAKQLQREQGRLQSLLVVICSSELLLDATDCRECRPIVKSQ
jgi:hypothetical protein